MIAAVRKFVAYFVVVAWLLAMVAWDSLYAGAALLIVFHLGIVVAVIGQRTNPAPQPQQSRPPAPRTTTPARGRILTSILDRDLPK